MYQPLPLPPFFDPKNADDPLYRPNADQLLAVAADWRRQHNLRDAAADRRKVHVLMIDYQDDFCFPPPEGALYVRGRSGRGAMDDLNRAAQFVYRNLGLISHVTCTMDTHVPYQVFSGVAHVAIDGTIAPPYTTISHDDYVAGRWRANPTMAAQLGADPNWLTRQWTYYCAELEKAGRFQLYTWPVHCILGDRGHTLAGVAEEARRFHAYARGSANAPAIKGGNPLTENYSVFRPEVMTLFDGRPVPGAQKNTTLISTLAESDMVIIMGEAASHCVAWSVADLIAELFALDPALAAKLYVLQDCMSAVVVPNVVDFTDGAAAAFAEYQDRGIHLVNSTDPIASWPGIAGQIAG